RSRHPAGGRTDGEPRLPHRRRDPGAVRRAARRGTHHRDGDARGVRRRTLRTHHPHPRRARGGLSGRRATPSRGAADMNMLIENLRTALEALFGNRLRSVLTLLGVVIGVFAVTTTISLGEIATAGITNEIRAFGAQTLFVSRVPNEPTSVRFTDDDIEALSRLPIAILRQKSLSVTASSCSERVRMTLNRTTANAPAAERPIRGARGRAAAQDDSV